MIRFRPSRMLVAASIGVLVYSEALSRVSAYDAVGSFGLAPVGTAVAGPLLMAFGASAVLAVGGGLVVLFTAAVFLVPEVRQLRRAPAPAAPAPSLP